ncbi:hypothetical protein ISCGN_026708 [Ixodes scapularis]
MVLHDTARDQRTNYLGNVEGSAQGDLREPQHAGVGPSAAQPAVPAAVGATGRVLLRCTPALRSSQRGHDRGGKAPTADPRPQARNAGTSRSGQPADHGRLPRHTPASDPSNRDGQT